MSRWGGNPKWGGNPRFGSNPQWGSALRWGLPDGGGGGPWYDDAVYAWKLTDNLDPSVGDMGAFSLSRASDRTYIDRDGNYQVARGNTGNYWYPSDPSDASELNSAVDVVFTPFNWGHLNLQNAVWFNGTASWQYIRNATRGTGVVGEIRRLSAYVIMDDGGKPVLGTSTSDPNGDMTLYSGGVWGGENKSYEEVGVNNIWRVAATFVTTSNTSYSYIDRRPTYSGRSFKTSGFQLEVLG